MSNEQAMELAKAIENAKVKLHRCRLCQDYTANEVCSICASPKRDRSVICVVESPRDVKALNAPMSQRPVPCAAWPDFPHGRHWRGSALRKGAAGPPGRHREGSHHGHQLRWKARRPPCTWPSSSSPWHQNHPPCLWLAGWFQPRIR